MQNTAIKSKIIVIHDITANVMFNPCICALSPKLVTEFCATSVIIATNIADPIDPEIVLSDVRRAVP